MKSETALMLSRLKVRLYWEQQLWQAAQVCNREIFWLCWDRFRDDELTSITKQRLERMQSLRDEAVPDESTFDIICTTKPCTFDASQFIQDPLVHMEYKIDVKEKHE